MIFIERKELEYKINQLRKELFQIVETTGLDSHETLGCSQKLDHLIMIYQKISYENRPVFHLKTFPGNKMERCY